MRLIILAILVYLLYLFIKKFTSTKKQQSQEFGYWKNGGQVEDEMIKDPQCNTYYPKKDMIQYTLDDEVLFFCSEDCKNKYLEEHQNNLGRNA